MKLCERASKEYGSQFFDQRKAVKSQRLQELSLTNKDYQTAVCCLGVAERNDGMCGRRSNSVESKQH
jgi:hypothetical protein